MINWRVFFQRALHKPPVRLQHLGYVEAQSLKTLNNIIKMSNRESQGNGIVEKRGHTTSIHISKTAEESDIHCVLCRKPAWCYHSTIPVWPRVCLFTPALAPKFTKETCVLRLAVSVLFSLCPVWEKFTQKQGHSKNSFIILSNRYDSWNGGKPAFQKLMEVSPVSY